MSCIISNSVYSALEAESVFPVLRCTWCGQIVRDDIAGDMLAEIVAAADEHRAVCEVRP